MTAIKYNGNKKSIINRFFDESIENLDAAVSCFNGIAIPSDLSDINNLITQLSGSRRIITVHKEGFSRACQALNDKELEMASNIGGLEYFNINKFTYSSGRVNTVSIFDGADLSFLSKYMSEEKWADYYGDTIDELTKKKEDLSDLVNRTISEKELNELKKKYPYLKFEYDKKTGKARILTPEEMQKRIDASNNKGSVGNVVTPDMARYKAEYEKWFEGRYKRSYSNYKNEISRIEQDILLLDSAKHDLEQIIKLKEYDVIKDSNDYKNYNQNYYRNHHGVNVNEEIRKYANVGYDDLVTGTKQYANTTLRDVMKYMNEDQKKMYCYLYNSKGRDEANKYLEALEDGINRTKGMEKYNQFVEKIAKRDSRGNIVTEKTRDRYGNTVEQVVFDTRLFSGNYIDTTLAGLGMGIKNFGEGFENLFSNKGTISSNQYAQMYIMNGLYNAKESGQSVEALTGTLEMAINTGNMLPSIALSTMLTFLCPPAAAGGVAIGNIAGSSLMGLSAAGNAKNQAYLSGANDAQANIYGALNGLSETTLGYFLGRIPGLSGASRGFLGDIASEGFEEFSQEYVDAALRAGILGEKIDFNQLSADATKSFLMGAASSGIMNVGMHPINSAMMNRNVSVMANQIVTERGLGKESIPAIEKLLREQIKLAEEQNSNLGNNGNSPKVIPISSTSSQNTSTGQSVVKEGKVISFNDATKNNNTSPKKVYTPPKAEIGGIALEEEVANNSAIPNSPKNSVFSNIGQKIKGMFSGKNGDVINNSIEQQSNKHTIDPEHGFQLNRSDFGTLINMVNYYESSDSFKNFGNDMLSQVNTKGYMSEYTGNYLTELVNGGEYDVYVKHILSENLDSINEDGVYCNGRGLSVGMNNVPKSISDVDLTATVYKIDNVYNAVGAIKNVSSGRSEGGNPINGALIIKVPKGTPMENILYWNETSGCFCIDPKYNDSYIVVDRNCNVSEPSFIDHEVTVLDTDTYNNVEDNSVYSELLEDINLIIKAHDKKYGEGSTIAALKAFCDPNSNNYLNYDLITSSDGARALLQEYTPKHIQKALELLSSQNKTIEMSKSSNNNANNQKTNNAQFEEYKRELKVMTTPEFAEFVKEYHSGNALVIAGEQRQDFLNIYTNFKNLVGSLRNSGTLTSSEIDFLNIIEGHASKYGYADAIERLSRMSDPNDVNYGRYELISSNGNARNFLSKYSLEQIRNNLINLGLVNDVVAPISDNIQNSDVVNNLNDNSIMSQDNNNLQQQTILDGDGIIDIDNNRESNRGILNKIYDKIAEIKRKKQLNNLIKYVNSLPELTCNDVSIMFGDVKQYLFWKLKNLALGGNQDCISFYNQLVKDSRTENTGRKGWRAVAHMSETEISNFLGERNLFTEDDMNVLKYMYDIDKQNPNLSQTEKNAIFIYTAWFGPTLAAYNRNKEIHYGFGDKVSIVSPDREKVQRTLDNCVDLYNKIFGTSIPSISIEQMNYIIDGIISKSSLPEDMFLYRGVNSLYYNGEKVTSLKPGMIINDASFTSTSALKMDNSYQGEANYVLKILAPKGTKAAYLEKYTGVSQYIQQEVLLAKNTDLEIIGYPVYNSETGQTEILARVLPQVESEIDSYKYIPNIEDASDVYVKEYGVTSGMSAKEVMDDLRNNNLLGRFNSEIDDIIMSRLYDGRMSIAEHNLEHIKNVLLYSMEIGNKLGITKHGMDLLIEAAKYHDSGLVYNNILDVNGNSKYGIDLNNSHQNHALLGSEVVADKLKGQYSNEDINIIRAIIEYHEVSTKIEDSAIEKICNKYGIFELSRIQWIKQLGDILKDADALDRTRFAGISKLDQNKLRTAVSRDLVYASCQIREQMAIEELNVIFGELSSMNNAHNQSIINELTYLMSDDSIPINYILFAYKYYSNYGYQTISDFVIAMLGRNIV